MVDQGTTTDETMVHKPALASWDAAGSASQTRLTAFLAQVKSVRDHIIATPTPRWVEFEIVRPAHEDLLRGFDVENYLTPVVRFLGHDAFVLARGWKRHAVREGELSRLSIGTAVEHAGRPCNAAMRVYGSYTVPEWKNAIRSCLLEGGARTVAEGRPLSLAMAFRFHTAGRNWTNLWKPAADALGPLLGEPHPNRPFDPADDRIVELEFHLDGDHTLAGDLELAISCSTMP